MDYRKKIEETRQDYIHGRIDLETAKSIVIPLLHIMNAKAAKIAREHGKIHRPLTFGYVFR